jgi:biopolymer transport protein ExbD
MLIITIPVQTHAVKLDLPAGNPPPPLVEPEVVDLVVDFDGSVTWNDAPVSNTAVLDQYLRSAALAENPPEIHLRPNRLVKYDYVAKVLAAAQRLGVKKIGFAGNEQYMQ